MSPSSGITKFEKFQDDEFSCEHETSVMVTQENMYPEIDIVANPISFYY